MLLVIVVNYASQALRFNNTTIGDVSSRYDNLFTPANYASAIWGLIFLGLLAYSAFQIKRVFFSEKDSCFVEQTGYWFFIANVLNSCWVFAFVYDQLGLSVLIMIGILFSLIKIILNTDMERWDAPIEILAFVWWPICLYSGWIAVATIANISAYLSKLGWGGSFLDAQQWTMVVIAAAVVINLLLIWKRNMREFAAVGIWALVAIYFRHKENFETLAYFALAGGLVLLVAAGIHGYKNRETNPLYKLKKKL